MADASYMAANAGRIIPATWRELQTVAALIDSPSARARFRSLGIPRQFFDHEGCQVVTAWALQGAAMPVPANVHAALTVPDGPEFMTLETALGMFRQGREDWALKDIDRHATAYAARWLPVYLRHWADKIETEKFALAETAVEIDQLLTLVRPLVLAMNAKEGV